jgi:hypothetical protein
MSRSQEDAVVRIGQHHYASLGLLVASGLAACHDGGAVAADAGAPPPVDAGVHDAGAVPKPSLGWGPSDDLDAGTCYTGQDGGFAPGPCAACAAVLADAQVGVQVYSDGGGCAGAVRRCVNLAPRCYGIDECSCAMDAGWSCFAISCP